MKLNKIAVILMAFGMFVVLINGGCGGQPEATLDKVLSVSDFPYILNGKQAVSMYFGGDKDNFVDITIHRNNIYKGFNVKSIKGSNDKKISGNCTLGGNMYFTSSKHDTYVYFSIDKLNKPDKVAEVTVSGKFIENQNFKETVTIPETTIRITGIYFENLIKKIP